MNKLELVRAGTTYQLNGDGTYEASSDSGRSAGRWTTKSDVRVNAIRLTRDGQQVLEVPARFAFHSGRDASGGRYINVLRIEVPAKDSEPAAEALFGGSIIIDDAKDIEYLTSEDHRIYIYGDLAFSPNYKELRIALIGGGEAAIGGSPTLGVVQDDLAPPLQRDLLGFTARTQWPDPVTGNPVPKRDATIRFTGHVGRKGDFLTFFGALDDNGKPDQEITLIGRYKVFSGGIQIREEDGQTRANLEVAGALSFKNAEGQFAIKLGHSDTGKLALKAKGSLEMSNAGPDAKSSLRGTVGFDLDDSGFKAELDLEGQFKIAGDKVVTFKLEADLAQNRLELALSGTIQVGKNGKIVFALRVLGDEISVEIGVTGDNYDFWIKILRKGSTLQVGFAITLRFPTGADRPVADPPALIEESTSEVPRLAVSPSPLRASPTPEILTRVITPESHAAYPRTTVGFSNGFSMLHPVLRRAVTELQTRLFDEHIPLFVFESFRTPQRQNSLFEQVPPVTRARAWSSYHQYGLAVDFVFYENGWHWGKNNQHDTWYRKLHTYARELGLEPLSWETPHIQLAGLRIEDLRRGRYPAEGDQAWGNHLTRVISEWNVSGGSPAAPPPPSGFPDVDRSPLDPRSDRVNDTGRRIMTAKDAEDFDNWHSRYGGKEWKVDVVGDKRGVILKGKKNPERTDGTPDTCRKIVELYDKYIAQSAIRFDVPEELIIMTIATETAFARRDQFTGRRTFRWEPNPREYSAGPMQVLSSTARSLIKKYGLDYDPFEVAPRYSSTPTPTPSTHPMYDPELSIELGTLAIKDNLGVTGCDPILVAAAYNAGSIKPSTANDWHLGSHGDHLDRAAKWFGDVFAI